MTRLSRALAIVGLLFAADVLAAQIPDSTRPGRGIRGGRGGVLPGARARGGQQPRAALENEVRQAFAKAVRNQLRLDDRQMRELKRTDDKFEARRRDLTRDERIARQTLRGAVEDSSGDPARIDLAMTRMFQIQRERINLLEAEHRELSAFMTPRQRAQYFAMRERVMRRLMEFDQGGRRGGPPPG